MSVPRSLRTTKGDEILSKWLDKIGIEENERFLFTAMLSCLANKLDKPGESYVVAIDLELYEDTDGCLKAKAGNCKAGYIEELGCLAIPRLMEYCGECRCEEKRRLAKEKRFVEGFDIKYISKYRLKNKVSLVDFANLSFIDTGRYADIERGYIKPDTEEKISIQYAYETLCKMEKKKNEEQDEYLLGKYDIAKVEEFRIQNHINKTIFANMCCMATDDYTQIVNLEVEPKDRDKISIMKAVQSEYKKIKSKKTS
jgi:hypothetical protein